MTTSGEFLAKRENPPSLIDAIDTTAPWSKSFDRDFLAACCLYIVLWFGLLAISISTGDFSVSLTPLFFSALGGSLLYIGGKVYAWYEQRALIAGKSAELRQDRLFFAFTGAVMTLTIAVSGALIVAWMLSAPGA